MIWNETKECMSRDEMTNLQSARLAKLVDKVYHNVEYYRKKMQAVGLEPGDIKGIEDLDKLPFTTKDDLRDTYPFGMFAVPNSQTVSYTHLSICRQIRSPEERWPHGCPARPPGPKKR